MSEEVEYQDEKPEDFAYIFETEYDKKSLKAMARVLRKTVRRKHSIRTHIFGIIVILLALLLTLGNGFKITSQSVVTWIAMLAVIIVMLFEDALNGSLAKKRMMPGMLKSRTTFGEDGYRSETEIGTSEFKYDGVNLIGEYRDYFVFVFGKNHAQVYDKRSITPDDPDGFRTFIQEKTGKSIIKVK